MRPQQRWESFRRRTWRRGLLIEKAALVVARTQRGSRQVLFVRELDGADWLLPGGQRMPGESIVDALRREIVEELGVAVDRPEYLQLFEGYTASGEDLRIQLYGGKLAKQPAPSGEVSELRWFSRTALEKEAKHLTPITIHAIIPYLVDRQLI